MVQNALGKGRKQEKGGGKGPNMAYDDVIISLGQFGRYQKRIYVLLCLPAISCALHKLAGVFLQAKVPHRCLLPWEDDNATYPLESAKLSMIFPWDNGLKQWSSCKRYDVNFTDSYFEGGIPGNTSVPCSDWVYDTMRYSSTTITEWDLVCDKNWVKATADALLMVGVMLGSIIFGDLSDRVGRKPIFFLSLVLQVIFGVAAALATDEYTFMIARMIVGATTSGVFLVAYVIAMEMVGPKRRMICGVGFQLFFTAGFVLTAGFAYLLRDWRHLQLAITLPGVVFFCYWWFIPESVRWQLTKGKTEEARSTLMAVAKENNKKLDENLLSDLFTQAEVDRKSDLSSGTKPSLLDLFKHRNLRNKSIIIFFLWLVNSGTYYGLSWNTSDLGGNDFINFIISGAVEVPAYTFLIFTLDRWGRKVILCGSMILGGLCLVAAIFVPKGMAWLNITLAMSGKLAITASYGTVYVLTAEQFPTVIRNVALGAGSTFARFGGILAPYINYTSEIWTPLPLIIFGIMALISGTSAMVLPETLNKKLPETIEDGEQFGKKEKKKEVAQPEEQVALKERDS